MKDTKPTEKRYLKWDNEKKHPFVFNKYFANSETRTLSHANSLYLDYNCTDRDLKQVRGRVVCNTIEEIRTALDNNKHIRMFTILSPLTQGLEEFNYPK